VGDEVFLYFDAYTRHRYEALATRDFKTWPDVSSQLSVPAGMRHGTAFAVPGDIVRKLLEPSKSLPGGQP
jgi:beta-galactosidase